mgnify:CR=1 FL=1
MTVTSPLVSVVIPTYNRKKLVIRAIQSVLNQTCQDFEIIVVDDASNDDGATLENINALEDSRIQFLKHSVRQHGGAARNTGIDAARGKYICFLDSDDVWLDSKLETYLAEPPKQEEILYGKLEKKGAYKGVFPKRAKGQSESVADYLFLSAGSMQTSTLMICTELARNIRFNPSLKRFQDYDFVIRAESQGAAFRYVDLVTVYQLDCDQENRISNSYDYKAARDWIESVRGLVSKKAFRQFYLKRVCHYAVMSGDKRQAARYLLYVIDSLFYEPLIWCKYLLVILLPVTIRKGIINAIKLKQS